MLLGPAIFERNVAPLDKACLAKTLMKGCHERRERARRGKREVANERHSFGLCTAEQRRQSSPGCNGHERAPPHSMTSSARARIDGGTVRPSALAVFRLIINSNLVGCWTGRSAGLAPLRIFPA